MYTCTCLRLFTFTSESIQSKIVATMRTTQINQFPLPPPPPPPPPQPIELFLQDERNY